MAATASGQTRERLTKMTLFGYYNPMGHTHATLRSTSSAFEQEGVVIRSVADDASPHRFRLRCIDGEDGRGGNEGVEVGHGK